MQFSNLYCGIHNAKCQFYMKAVLKCIGQLLLENKILQFATHNVNIADAKKALKIELVTLAIERSMRKSNFSLPQCKIKFGIQ